MLGLHGKGPGYLQHDHDRSHGTDDGQHDGDGDDPETLQVYSRAIDASGNPRSCRRARASGKRLIVIVHVIQPDDGVGRQIKDFRSNPAQNT
jgi:hypothetical protein